MAEAEAEVVDVGKEDKEIQNNNNNQPTNQPGENNMENNIDMGESGSTTIVGNQSDINGNLTQEENNDWGNGNRTFAEAAAAGATHEEQIPTTPRKDRSFTFFNLMAPTDISDSVIEALASHFQQPQQVVENIQRDTRFHSRYNVIFKDPAQKNRLVNEGIVINGVPIRGRSVRPRPSITKLYIPNFLAWGIELDRIHCLMDAGVPVVVYTNERVSKEHSIPIGMWNVGVISSLEYISRNNPIRRWNLQRHQHSNPKGKKKHPPGLEPETATNNNNNNRGKPDHPCRSSRD